MKKLICSLLCCLLAGTVCYAAEPDIIRTGSSALNTIYCMDFEQLPVGGEQKELVAESGRSRLEIVEEDGNRFLRQTNLRSNGANAVLHLPQGVSGQIAIEFDIRMKFVAICDIPLVYGISEAGAANREIVRFRVSDNGTVQVGQTNSSVSEGARSIAEWKHVVLLLDTDTDSCFMRYGGQDVGHFNFTVPASEINRLTFSSRNLGQTIDLDNIEIYYGTLANTAASGEAGGNSNTDGSVGIPMPTRETRAAAVAYRPNSAITVDGHLQEEDWEKCTLYNLVRIGQGSKLADAGFSVMRDDQGIYVGVWIYDDKKNDVAPPDQGWLRDQVEIYIDGNHSHNRYYDDTDRQYSYGYRQTQLDEENASQKRMAEGVQYAQQDTDFGWTAELYIPVSAFGMPGLKAGDTIGFDVGYNDSNSENARAGQLLWRGTQNNAAITNAYGDLLLSDLPVGEAATEAEAAIKAALVFEAGKSGFVINGRRRSGPKRVAMRSIEQKLYLPFRLLMEQLGATVEFQDGVATATYMGNEISIAVSDMSMHVNGAPYAANANPAFVEDSLYIAAEDLPGITGKQIKTVDGRFAMVSDTALTDDVAAQMAELIKQN